MIKETRDYYKQGRNDEHEDITTIQKENNNVKIGSYPYFKDGDFGVTLVIKCESDFNLKNVSKKIFTYLLIRLMM